MNGPLEQTRGNLEPSNSEDEDQFVSEKVEKQEQKVPVASEIAIKDEGYEPRILQPQKPLEMTREDEDSQLSQTFLTQKLSIIESVIEKYEEEMKKCWKDQQTSSMKKLLSQMLGAKEGVEEQESEEVIPENVHSSEAKKYMKKEFMEPSIQKALDEYKTPIITQQPSFEFKGVKATSKSTNPVPDPASKINQAMYKRKLAERKPRKGTIAETSSPLRSFLLTNWKKRKKVKNERNRSRKRREGRKQLAGQPCLATAVPTSTRNLPCLAVSHRRHPHSFPHNLTLRFHQPTHIEQTHTHGGEEIGQREGERMRGARPAVPPYAIAVVELPGQPPARFKGERSLMREGDRQREGSVRAAVPPCLRSVTISTALSAAARP
ncbi:hypothetical protein AHAS_Ahas13G0302200 [Arachis hypogaea]